MYFISLMQSCWACGNNGHYTSNTILQIKIIPFKDIEYWCAVSFCRGDDGKGKVLLEGLPFFLLRDFPLIYSASRFNPSIFFFLISSNKNNATTSLSFSVVLFLPIAMTKLYHESGNEQSKLMHFSSSMILISMDNN